MNDQLFHRKKASKCGLERKEGRKPVKRRFLIGCEGSKTEYTYFKRLIHKLGLTSVDIEIVNDCGSAPISIYKYIVDRVKNEAGSEAHFDEAFCVFDHDTHESFDDVCNNIKNRKNNRKNKDANNCKIQAITSTPCFEIWLMLHFNYSTQPILAKRGKSCGEIAKIHMKKIGGFEKYDGALTSKQLDLLMDKIDQAIKNAEKLNRYNSSNNSSNPSTEVYILVDKMKKLSDNN
ncbi:RloB domain-containing protein [Bartonella sp. M0187]|uniref:RloB family protein n=1 Tax=Bartonella apihabitans TaxID=2750929 RepID=UPI0018DC4E13|nr:RloB family protein [Bartonella apihabitans]MBI0025410.1 RloB domain-containing protein [Bartonella apihabitans]